ncbi:MAG: hypothetical protein ABIK65_06615 [Candidatus Eisenbacteria bacterium]
MNLVQTVILLSLASLFFAAGAAAGVIRVPDDQPTIAAGLAAAGAGDTVLVAPGVYQENLLWPSTGGIRLIGEGGPAETIVDGRGLGSVIEIAGGADSTTLIKGLTLQNGRAYGG